MAPRAVLRLMLLVNAHALQWYKRFRVDGRKRIENTSCGRKFFKNKEKKFVLKRKRMRVDGALKRRASTVQTQKASTQCIY